MSKLGRNMKEDEIKKEIAELKKVICKISEFTVEREEREVREFDYIESIIRKHDLWKSTNNIDMLLSCTEGKLRELRLKLCEVLGE